MSLKRSSSAVTVGVQPRYLSVIIQGLMRSKSICLFKVKQYQWPLAIAGQLTVVDASWKDTCLATSLRSTTIQATVIIQMDPPSQILSSADNLADSVNDLHVSDVQMPPLPDTSTESNPWQDQPAALSNQPIKPMELLAPHLPVIDNSIYVPPESVPPPLQEPERDANTEEVLNEFDPLADRGEQAAREAWALSESNPPPPQPILVSQPEAPISDSESPEPPPKDIPSKHSQPPSDSSRASGSNFPSLASFARTFSIPAIARTRPISIDTAKAVPSPATLSSFAAQQDQRPHDPENSSAVTRSSTPGGGTDSPISGRERDKEQTFDFQKFLDQMKLKGAEPVGRFLRSYVLLVYFYASYAQSIALLLRFLSNFAKRTFTVNDQVKIINDFLNVSSRSASI